jgi:hypothetical protein
VCTLAVKKKIRAGFDMSDRTIPLVGTYTRISHHYRTERIIVTDGGKVILVYSEVTDSKFSPNAMRFSFVHEHSLGPLLKRKKKHINPLKTEFLLNAI